MAVVESLASALSLIGQCPYMCPYMCSYASPYVCPYLLNERERERERCSCCPKERRDRLKKLPILIVGYIYVCVIIGLTCIDYRCNCCPKERKEWLKIAMVEPREAAGPSIKIMCNTFIVGLTYNLYSSGNIFSRCRGRAPGCCWCEYT